MVLALGRRNSSQEFRLIPKDTVSLRHAERKEEGKGGGRKAKGREGRKRKTNTIERQKNFFKRNASKVEKRSTNIRKGDRSDEL